MPRASGRRRTVRRSWACSGVPLDDSRLFYLTPERLALEENASRTRPNGLFQAPGRLLLGLAYRLVVRAEGFSLVSGWFTANEQTTVLPAIKLPPPPF